MKAINYSFIIPVYNRPEEIEKLLLSISNLSFEREFEVVVIEDGSEKDCKEICSRFRESVDITYIFKSNSGPGDSRNYGMKKAKGEYFIILDSDCILPQSYLNKVDSYLNKNYVDSYGGPDAAHESFTDLQKSINYSMTSFLTTGGIRGANESLGRFQPRSFNMGLSKHAFEATGGFNKIHPGEDPDLTLRLWKNNFETALIKDAFVYHERRISWVLFYRQVHKFGMVRVILNKWHPNSNKITYWFPTVFILGLFISVASMFLGVFWPIVIFAIYFLLIFIHSTLRNGFVVGFKSIVAASIQFYAYGTGFFKSWLKIFVFKIPEEKAFPKLFFK